MAISSALGSSALLPGLVLVKSQTIGSAVSSVTVSDCFSSTYDNYKIVVSGGAVSSASQNLRLQLGSSTTGYYSALVYIRTDTPTTVRGDALDNTAAYFEWAGIGNVDGLAVDMTLMNVALAKKTTGSAVYAFEASGDAYIGQSTHYHTVATAYTGFTLTCAGGTMTGGVIRVYGYRN